MSSSPTFLAPSARKVRPAMTTPQMTSPAHLPTRWGTFSAIAFRFSDDVENGSCEHLAIIKGDISDIAGTDILARVHSSCVTGDIIGSQRCDCGPQLALALQRIEAEGRGVVLYLNQEGRGIGLYNKIRAYTLQDEGANTVEANERLGFQADGRDYDQAAAMFRALGVESVRLMTNNPRKVESLEAAGIPITQRVPHAVGETEANKSYLDVKRDVLGHLF